MKTKLYLNLAALFLLAITSCKKQDDTIVSKLPPTKTPTASALKYIKKISVDYGGGYIETTEMVYDSKKRVVEINESEGVFTKYIYDGDNITFEEVKATYSGPTSMHYSQYFYNNGILQKRADRDVYPGQADDIGTYEYTIVNGHVAQTKHVETTYLIKFTYINDNIATFTSGTQKYSYVYDDKKNPFINSLAKYWMGANVDMISKNNVLTKVYPNGASKTTVYKYDADGYPINATTTDAEKITYEYVTL